MTTNRIAYMALIIAGTCFASSLAIAEDAISHPAKKPMGQTTNAMVPSLAVLNSKGATLQGNKLTLSGFRQIPSFLLIARYARRVMC